MRITKLFFSLIISSLVCLFILQATPASAAGGTTLQISPVIVNVKAGEQFTLTTKAIPTVGKNYTVRFSIKFLPELVSVQNWTYAGVWMPVNQPGFEELNNDTGVLVRTAGYPGGFDAVATFGTVTFLAKKTGITSVFIDAESFSLDSDGSNVAIVGDPAIITIAEDVPLVAVPVNAPIIAPNPVPISTPTPAPESVLIPEIPEVVPDVLPTQLFDIKLSIDSAVLNRSNNLVARVNFENFGIMPTPVELNYRVFDSNNKEVYTANGNTKVETEQILTKEFKDLKLGNGKYTLVVNTKYGENVSDDFRQVFEVNRTFFGVNIIVVALIAGALALIVIGFILNKFSRRRKNKK